jgi:SAM-dependent methyltransferase
MSIDLPWVRAEAKRYVIHRRRSSDRRANYGVLAELVHLCRHAPSTVALMRRLPQAELYATLIERADAAGLADQRARLVADLTGRVVEIGCGTGAMFAYYGDADVTAIEPEPTFAAHARAAATDRITVIEGAGESLPLADASVDAAVLALVLCSVPSVDAVLREVVRVVRPGGAVRLIEHVISPRRLAGALMHLVDPLWLRLNGQGCHLDRDPMPALERAGLRVERSDRFQIWSAGLPAFPMKTIFATRR